MTRLTVEFEWAWLGVVSLDASGRLLLPSAASAPGLYQFWLGTVDVRPGVYIGETANLRDRFQGYRTPGARLRTNLRVNLWLIGELREGARISVLVATSASVQLDAGEPTHLDMARKNQRLVAEQSAIAAALLVEDLADDAGGPGRPRVLNRPGIGEEEYG